MATPNLREFATYDELVAFWPVASALPYSQMLVETVLETSKCQFNRALWGCNLWRGHVLYTIHALRLWALSVSSGSGLTPTGQIASMTQGPFSASFATAPVGSVDEASLASTAEGLAYLDLLRSLGPTAVALRGGGRCRRW